MSRQPVPSRAPGVKAGFDSALPHEAGSAVDLVCRAEKLHADKAYGHRRCQASLWGCGIGCRIARKGIESSQKFSRHRRVVERPPPGSAASDASPSATSASATSISPSSISAAPSSASASCRRESVRRSLPERNGTPLPCQGRHLPPGGRYLWAHFGMVRPGTQEPRRQVLAAILPAEHYLELPVDEAILVQRFAVESTTPARVSRPNRRACHPGRTGTPASQTCALSQPGVCRPPRRSACTTS